MYIPRGTATKTPVPHSKADQNDAMFAALCLMRVRSSFSRLRLQSL